MQIIDALSKTKARLNISAEDERKPDIQRELAAQTRELSAIAKEVKKLASAFPLKKQY